MHCSESDQFPFYLTSDFTIKHQQCSAYFHLTATTNLQSGCLCNLPLLYSSQLMVFFCNQGNHSLVKQPAFVVLLDWLINQGVHEAHQRRACADQAAACAETRERSNEEPRLLYTYTCMDPLASTVSLTTGSHCDYLLTKYRYCQSVNYSTRGHVSIIYNSILLKTHMLTPPRNKHVTFI